MTYFILESNKNDWRMLYVENSNKKSPIEIAKHIYPGAEVQVFKKEEYSPAYNSTEILNDNNLFIIKEEYEDSQTDSCKSRHR